MKIYSIQYTHIAGHTNEYSTQWLSEYLIKLEKVLDDPYVNRESIVLGTMDDSVSVYKPEPMSPKELVEDLHTFNPRYRNV